MNYVTGVIPSSNLWRTITASPSRSQGILLTSSREIRDRLDAALPIRGIEFGELLKVFRETIIPFSRQNAHPRMFGPRTVAWDSAGGDRRRARLDAKFESDGLAFGTGASGS